MHATPVTPAWLTRLAACTPERLDKPKERPCPPGRTHHLLTASLSMSSIVVGKAVRFLHKKNMAQPPATAAAAAPPPADAGLPIDIYYNKLTGARRALLPMARPHRI